jgi:hypothetical protein
LPSGKFLGLKCSVFCEFSAVFVTPHTGKNAKTLTFSLNLGIGFLLAMKISIQQNVEIIRAYPLIPMAVKLQPISGVHQFGEGGFMYLLFGPAMAALVVIAVIQLRDHFVASR